MEKDFGKYSLLIVNADPGEIEEISSCLRWNNLPLNFYSALSIKEAEETVRSTVIDIVLTDTELPEGSGLGVIEALRSAGCEAKVIIYSASRDFDLARAAISLHVSEFLPKPFDRDAMTKSVRSVMDELENSARTEKRVESLLLENRSYKSGRILMELISGNAGSLSEGAGEFAARNFSGKYVTLVLIETTEPIAAKREERILQLVLQYTREVSMCLNLSENRELLFFISERLPNRKVLSELGEYIRHKINATFAVDCFVMVGMPSPNGKKLSQVFRRMDNLAEYRFYMRQGAVLLDREKYFTGSNIDDAIEGLLNHIYEDIRYCEYDKAADNIHLLVKTIEAESGLSNIYVRHIFIEILGKLAASSHDISSEENLELVKFVMSASDIFAIEEKVAGTVKHLAFRKTEQDSRLGNGDRAVEEVIKIIRKEYARPDLSIEYLASRVFLSPNYLSVLFKKNKGIAINAFLLNYRLEKAKKLLTTTNIKVNEIARTVGYSSSSYFVTVFRTNVGVAPSKYREDNAKLSKKPGGE